MLLKFSLFLFLVFYSGSTLAASFCREPDVVTSHVNDCTENQYVSEAAVLCLKKVRDEVTAAQAAVNAGTAINSANADDNQVGKQQNASLDYQLSKVALEALILQAKAAQLEVIAYEKLLEKPEDFNEPDITGMNPSAYLKSTPCFQENKQVIRNVAEDIDYIIFDLEHARDIGDNLGAASQGNKTNMDSVTSGKASDKKIRKGPGVKKGTSKNSKSDITGTKPVPPTN